MIKYSFHHSVRAVAVAALGVALAASAGLAQQPSDQQEQLLPPGLERDGGPDAPETRAADPASAAPADPITTLIRNSSTSTTLGRATLRDNLYAMLATAESEEVAKRIGEEIEKLWLMPGSDTVSVLMLRSNEALKNKDSALALKFLDAALQLAPDYAEAWNRRAYVYYEAGDLRRAVGDLRRVLALDPNHFKALHGLGTIMRELDQDAAALKAYERLVEVNPYWEGAQKSYDDLKAAVQGRGI